MGTTGIMNSLQVFFLVALAALCSAEQAEEYGVDDENYIIGGQPAGHGEFPYQISLRMMRGSRGQHICGGTLISSTWVLCAAHCFQSRSPSSYRVRVGKWHLNSPDGSEQDIPIAAIHVHSQFNSPQQFQHDIALLQLARPASGAYVGTASLPAAGADYRGQTCTLSGWGLVRRHPQQLADQLQKVTGQIWTRAKAQAEWGRNKPPGTVVFGEPGRWSACMGDSGGPLACGGTVVGVVSFGPGECAGKPGVFTEVSQFIDWIQSKMGGSGGGGGTGGGDGGHSGGGGQGGAGAAACPGAGPLVAHESDCSKYYQCIGRGQGILGSCGPGLRFDKRIGMCNWAQSVQC